MNDQKLQSFIDLVTFDQNLIKLENSVESSSDKVNQLRRDLEQLQQLLHVKESEKKELKKQLDLQELTVKELQEKEKHQVDVYQAAATTKEQDAAHRELEHVKVERDKQEQRLMKLFNTYESAEKDLESARQAHEAKSTEIQAEISKEIEIMQGFEKELEDLEQQRDTRLATVPDEWLKRYENMRGRVVDPVVPVQQDSCSACFYSISSRDLQTLKQGDLLQCKDCYRFLYYPAETE